MFILTCDPECSDITLEEIGDQLQSAEFTRLDEGVFLVRAEPESSRALLRRWQRRPPVFPRHVFAVDHHCTELGHWSELKPLVADLPLRKGQPFSVQVRSVGDGPRPGEVAAGLAETLKDGYDLNVRRPRQVISVLLCGGEAFLGLAAPDENLSAWNAGQHHLAREPEQISRAEFKLLEALEVFGVQLRPRQLALDLGAAPGGWSRILLERGLRVVAVDPAALDPVLEGRPGLTQHRMTAQRYLSRPDQRFDLLLNDMKMDALESAQLMLESLMVLKPSGTALLTLKLPEHDRRGTVERALALLGQGYQIGAARHLFHNRSEVTVLLRPLGGSRQPNRSSRREKRRGKRRR